MLFAYSFHGKEIKMNLEVNCCAWRMLIKHNFCRKDVPTRHVQ